jgi:hypothetical protein
MGAIGWVGGGQVSQLNAAHAFFSADYPIKYISNFFTQLE